jgi:histidine triad (HIT) family protein
MKYKELRMTVDASCIFCRIIAGEAEASMVFEDDMVVVFMDIQPVTPGHLLVVPRKHVVDLAGLDDFHGARMFTVARGMAAALRGSGLRCEGVNLFLADGSAAGQTVFHTHLHVLPRFAGDGFGFQFPQHYHRRAAREMLDTHAELLKSSLGALEKSE